MSDTRKGQKTKPIEQFHALLIDEFHLFRLSKTTNINVKINGMEFSDIIAKAKTRLIKK